MFNCPANLASHRRWHKPKVANNQRKPAPTTATTTSTEIVSEEEHTAVDKLTPDVPSNGFPCKECGKTFRR